MTTRKRAQKELARYHRERETRERTQLPRVKLRARRQNTHPWVYRRMLEIPRQEVEPGALVEAYSRNGEFVGKGFYNGHSEIALRLLTDDPREIIDAAWFRKQIAAAARMRNDVLHLPDCTDAYRVVHSEGDGLSGLVVDRFGSLLVAELFSAGMHRYWKWVAQGLEAAFPSTEIVVRADRRSEKLEGVKMDGPPPSEKARHVVIQEHGAKFHVDLRRGHKTGYFLDQRENRQRMAQLSRGQTLFDGFCYTGGFAIHAAKTGAKHVEAVDLDEDVLSIGEKNRSLNGLKDKIDFQHGNVFDVLRAHRTAKRRFPRMVLDPAKLAIARHERSKALGAYRDMNRLGIQCLERGGVLLSCSCTGLISEEDFLDALRSAADEARVDLQIFHIDGAAPDHPFAARMPEGRYLKAVFARVR